MVYTPKVWKDGASGGTPITADALNHLETQYSEAVKLVSTASNELEYLRGVRYVAYGHSFGQLNNPAFTWPGSLYPERVKNLIGADPSYYSNRTISGAQMANIRQRAQETWVSGEFGVVTLLGNQNDMGVNHATDTNGVSFKAQVKGFIDVFRANTDNPPTIVICYDTTDTAVGYARYGSNPPTDADVARYNGYLAEVVATYPNDGSIIIARPDIGWNPTTHAGPDGQHPNDRGSAHIARAIVTALATQTYRAGVNYGMGTATPPAQVLITDTFERTVTNGLGVADSGQTWTTFTGSAFAVSNGVARSTSNAAGEANRAVINTTASDIDSVYELDAIGPAGQGQGQAYRFSADLQNGYVLDIGNVGEIGVYKMTSGVYSKVKSFPQTTAAAGSKVRLIAKGDLHSVYLNGTLLGTHTDATFNTNTRHGVRITGDGTLSGCRSFTVAVAQ